MHAVFVPQLLYGCSTWYSPHKRNEVSKAVMRKLEDIQCKAERIITGAFRATSKLALNIETHTLPIKSLLAQSTYVAAIRMMISPTYELIVRPRSTKRHRMISSLKRLTSSLQEVAGIEVNRIEKIASFVKKASPW